MSLTHTVTLGMGCFWSPDALFGQLPGVLRTRTGYAGGTTANPTYHELGDHTETVELDFDPQQLQLEHLLDVFWSNHNPVNINGYKGRQYQSLLLYRDPAQRDIMNAVLAAREAQGHGRPGTEISPFTGFTLAEDRHQKYYLKRFPDAVEKLSTLYATAEQLTNATLAARLNGLAKGYTNLHKLVEDIRTWPIDAKEQQQMIELVRGIRW